MRRSNFMYFWYFKQMLIFLWFCLILCCKYLCIFSVFIYALCLRQNFWCNCFNLRFKIDVAVMIIWSIVININSVLTLQVLTASLPHDRKPCEIKVVSNHTCSLYTCVCAGSGRVRVRLSGFWRQGISSTPGGFLKCPIPVRVCAEQNNSEFLSVDTKIEEYSQNSLPNPSAEEKTTRNSVPWKKY